MCGRYTLFSDTEMDDIRDIIEEVQRKSNGEIKTGEVFPTDIAPILLQEQNTITPEPVKWGFPGFNGKGVIINARSESAMEKPMFRKSLYTKRCVIPSTGFYEWSHNKDKQKYLFNLPDTQALYLAGLYNDFDGEKRFVILTTNANASMLEIHNRMPIVLSRESANQWIIDSQMTVSILNQIHPLLNRIFA